MSESFLNGKVTLLRGDCLELLPTLEENSIDSCVTDPPYHLTSQIATTRSAFPGRFAGSKGASRGFMGKQWDGGDIAFRPELWGEVLRVLKPGAHLLAFSGTRTYHRMACAIEDAGFEIRDQLGFAYGSGFPKSHNISKHIDRALGVEPTIISRSPNWRESKRDREKNGSMEVRGENAGFIMEATSPEAIQWQGWGTALKPAWEPIVLARKPLSEPSIAANVLKHGVGVINIDGCRVPTFAESFKDGRTEKHNDVYGKYGVADYDGSKGRWPANLIHDGSEEVLERFPETGGGSGPIEGNKPSNGVRGWIGRDHPGFPDSGSAARFFYTAKADNDDRLGSKHPTVKPLDLMQYLCRLITPRGGTCLDPFSGTGTTGEAAWREGFKAILIEREEEYQADIVKRMGLCLSGPDERRAASVKQLPPDDLPIFGGL